MSERYIKKYEEPVVVDEMALELSDLFSDKYGKKISTSTFESERWLLQPVKLENKIIRANALRINLLQFI